MLRERAASAMSGDESGLNALSQRAADLMEQRSVLAKLQSERVTRDGQADSVNPKTMPSPYTNILGLQRTFRPSVRQGIIIASIVFGVIALAVLGYIIYGMIVIPAETRTAYIPSPGTMTGGKRSK